MQTSDQGTEKLHRQASAQYLQGKFGEALATWRQILAADPEDERAREGLRLCELLAEDGAIAADAAAVVEPAPVTEEPIEFAVPEFDLDIPALEIPDPERQAEGVEPGETPATLDPAGDVEPAPEPVEYAIPEVDVECVEPATDDAAGTELKHRIQDLMLEALAAYSSGDNDAARSVLARVFILDETHVEALQLQEQIENGVPSATETVDVADLDAPDHAAVPGEFDLLSDDPDAAAVPEFDLPDVPGQPVETEPVEEIESLQLGAIETAPQEAVAEDSVDPLPEFDEDDEVFEDAPAAGTKRVRLPQFDVGGSSKTRWIVIGVVVGIVAVVGIGFWMRLRDTRIRDGAAVVPVAQVESAAAETVAETPAEPAPAGASADPANAASPADVDSLLAQGREAFADGDYAAAMLAFNAVLEQDPTHMEATERMQASTDGYKRTQEAEKQWIAAASLFRDGEYRSSMKLFYRLETDNEEDAERLDRYKTNGWYNMAVLALRAGHCDLARSHLTEAEQINPEDVDVATAEALADSCDAGSRKTGFQRAMRVIPLRGLDD